MIMVNEVAARGGGGCGGHRGSGHGGSRGCGGVGHVRSCGTSNHTCNEIKWSCFQVWQ